MFMYCEEWGTFFVVPASNPLNMFWSVLVQGLHRPPFHPTRMRLSSVLKAAAVAAPAASTDVAIVGGGVVGMSFAAQLARAGSGLRVTLVDSERGTTAPVTVDAVRSLPEPDLRTFAITPASARLLGPAWDRMLHARATPFYDMQVWEKLGTGYMRFGGDQGSPLGYIVENRVLNAALAEELQDLQDKGLVEVVGGKVANMSLPGEDGDGIGDDSLCSLAVTAPGDTQPSILSAKLVVGADGANSIVRRHAGLGQWGWDYDNSSLVATVKTSVPHSTAWQRFLPTGPVAILPLWDSYSSIVWSTTPSEARRLSKCSPDQFVAELNAALTSPSDVGRHGGAGAPAGLLGYLGKFATSTTQVLNAVTSRHCPFRDPPHIDACVGPRGSFPLRLSLANSYVRPRVALIGDAGHTTHPLAGQGMNLGIQDAAALARCLALGASIGADVGSIHTLREYEARRRGDNAGMILAVDAVKRLFDDSAGVTPLSVLRSLGMAGINAVDPLKGVIAAKAKGDSLNIW